MSTCDHHCDPADAESRRLDSSHFLDCPVWTYLGVTHPTHTTEAHDAPEAS